MAPHSSTLAWKIPWTEEPGGLQSMGSRLSNFTFTFYFPALEKEMATHSSTLARRIPGAGEPGGLLSMGSHRVGHNWSDLAAAAAAGPSFFRDYKIYLQSFLQYNPCQAMLALWSCPENSYPQKLILRVFIRMPLICSLNRYLRSPRGSQVYWVSSSVFFHGLTRE